MHAHTTTNIIIIEFIIKFEDFALSFIFCSYRDSYIM